MNPALAETIYADFITSSPTTGAAIDADSTPTCEVFEDATDTAILSPTVVKRTGKTGNYRVPIACTGANGFEAGKSYNAVVSATVGTIAAKAVIQTFIIRTNDEDDLATQASLTTLTGYVDTEVAAILAAVDTEVAAIKAKTDNLPIDPADESNIAASFATLSGKVDVIDDFLDTEIAAIKAKTDQLTFTGGKVDANATLALVAGDITAIADGILKRDWTAVSGEAAYSLLNAARMLRNVWNTTGGTLSVKKEDGTTNAWQRTLSVDPTAQPIIGAT